MTKNNSTHPNMVRGEESMCDTESRRFLDDAAMEMCDISSYDEMETKNAIL